jgi:hypothetical protein
MLRTEIFIVQIVAADIEHGREVSPAAMERLRRARERIEVAING